MPSVEHACIEGKWIERRAVLATPFAAAAALMIARAATAQSGAATPAVSARGSGALAFDEFVAACGTLAAELLRAEKQNHDLHLHRIAGESARIALASVPRAKARAFGGSRSGGGIRTDPPCAAGDPDPVASRAERRPASPQPPTRGCVVAVPGGRVSRPPFRDPGQRAGAGCRRRIRSARDAECAAHSRAIDVRLTCAGQHPHVRGIGAGRARRRREHVLARRG